MTAKARRAALVDAAAEAFAADGFSVTTRDLARRMGVTQALIYKHFASKEALTDAVLDRRFLTGGPAPDTAVLAGPGPLDDRLARFYAGFAEAGGVRVRLFLRASLDGLGIAARYRDRLDARFLDPVIGALRGEAGVPALSQRPRRPEEREVALALHGALVFTRIRREVYAMEFPLGHAALIGLIARVYVPGAVAEITRFNT